ncbi:OLC1v1011600C2 [Oldenlandia corymbosa var. corymbosa]|uniref:OLC1v1011600C2 n=1 Tax=Oldenlandia corymbosa var. corymbosa TaxID=529605 RepID=A0AAV1DTY2_OLDCO|nr:OLC1v1011600C2 [Oldenlandia corymbosa var. corymbosa]
MATARITPSPSALSTTFIKHLSCNLNLHSPIARTLFTAAPNSTRSRRPTLRLTRKSFKVSMSSVHSTDPLEVCAKASVTTPNTLGDCPFTQRVLLTLEEKHLPYELKLVDLSNKPEWFLELSPKGLVPLIKLDDKWIPDSDVITEALEEKFPEPPLPAPTVKDWPGSNIFRKFIDFLKSKNPNDGTERALLDELTAFNGHIKDNGPFIYGDKISAADLSLGPKLYHLEIALGHYKKWSVPDSLPYLKSYMEVHCF